MNDNTTLNKPVASYYYILYYGAFIVSHLNIQKPPTVTKIMIFQKYKQTDFDKSKSDIEESWFMNASL